MVLWCIPMVPWCIPMVLWYIPMESRYMLSIIKGFSKYLERINFSFDFMQTTRLLTPEGSK